jgi:hypothetical protein
VFFDEPPRVSLPRPLWRWVVPVLLVVAGGVAIALLLARDPAPEPIAAVPAARAEQRLERQLTGGPPGAVRCPGSIRPGRASRCEFRYEDGDTQLMLVTVSANGELDIEVPYPAQRRPGG